MFQLGVCCGISAVARSVMPPANQSRLPHLIEEECGVRYHTDRPGAFCGNWSKLPRLLAAGLALSDVTYIYADFQ